MNITLIIYVQKQHSLQSLSFWCHSQEVIWQIFLHIFSHTWTSGHTALSSFDWHSLYDKIHNFTVDIQLIITIKWLNRTHNSDTFTFFPQQKSEYCHIFSYIHARFSTLLHSHATVSGESKGHTNVYNRDTEDEILTWTNQGDIWHNQGAFTHITQNFINIIFHMYTIFTFMHPCRGLHTHTSL